MMRGALVAGDLTGLSGHREQRDSLKSPPLPPITGVPALLRVEAKVLKAWPVSRQPLFLECASPLLGVSLLGYLFCLESSSPADHTAHPLTSLGPPATREHLSSPY